MLTLANLNSLSKKILSLILLSSLSYNSFSQDFLGISTGNYGGVTGVLLQPASIVDSRFKFDINLFSTDVRYSNNYFLVNRDAILKFNKNDFGDYQTFKAKYLSEATLAAGEKAYFNVTNRTQLPSFMATLSEKSAIALSFQSRSMIQGRGISKDLAQMAYNGFYYQPLNNLPIDGSGLSINSLSWVEAGLTYGRVLYSSDRHFIKGAFTAKYLGGVASLNMGSDNFTLGVNSDSTININTNNFRYNHNKNADFDMVFDRNFSPDANAFGFDAGLVYEYRGNLKNFKYIKNDDEKSFLADRRDVNKYIFKLGVSLLDAGMFSFDKPNNVNSFSANISGWDIRNGNYNTIKAFDTALANRVVANANDPRRYNIYLPVALSVQLDIRFVKGLYLNAMAYRPLKMGNDAGTRFDSYGYYTITPRYERRHFGIYFPYTFSDKNDITDYRENRLGVTVRAGPLFIGSSNLGTMAFNKNLKAADVHLGLKIGFTYGKPTKVSRLFETKPQEMVAVQPVPPTRTIDSVSTIMSPPVERKSQLLVDYTKGQVYAVDSNKGGQIIIINNNYYYGNNFTEKKDSMPAERIVQNFAVDSMQYIRDTIQLINERNKAKADSIKKKLTDSINKKKVQVDSLINRLQLLRNQMDSTKVIDSTGATRINRGKTITEEGASEVATTVVEDSLNLNDTVITANPATTVSRRADQKEAEVNEPVEDSANMTKKKPALAVVKKKSDRVLIDTTKVVNISQGSKKAPEKIVKKQQSNATVVPEYSLERRLRQDDELMKRYFAESNQLQNDINRLQRKLNDQSSNQNTIAYPYSLIAPLAAPSPTRTKTDTVYIRDTIRAVDTIRIRDTMNIVDTLNFRDTINITRRDTVNIKSVSRPQRIFVPVETEKIIVEKIDYTKLPVETVLFPLGSANVRAVYNNKLNYLAGILLKNVELKLLITGHTDKTGSVKVNEALSLKRASAVRKYFVNKGVSETRMNIKAVSNNDPVVTENNKSDASQNRRVVIEIVN